MNIWDVYAQQMQKYLILTEACYIMSGSSELSYLLVSIILLSQYRVAIIFTVTFKINYIAFTIKGSFEGLSN